LKKKQYSTMLLWSAALISVVRYAGAFMASDVGSITGLASEALIILMGITGIGMGILDSIGSAFLFNGWRISMPKSGAKWPFRFKILTFFVFTLILDGIIILVPFTVSRVLGQGMGTVLGEVSTIGVWWWALAVNIAPVILIGGIMSGNANMITDDSSGQLSGNIPDNSSRVAEKSQRDWRKVRSQLNDRELQAMAYEWTTTQITSMYNLPNDGRCARNWKQYATRELDGK